MTKLFSATFETSCKKKNSFPRVSCSLPRFPLHLSLFLGVPRSRLARRVLLASRSAPKRMHTTASLHEFLDLTGCRAGLFIWGRHTWHTRVARAALALAFSSSSFLLHRSPSRERTSSLSPMLYGIEITFLHPSYCFLPCAYIHTAIQPVNPSVPWYSDAYAFSITPVFFFQIFVTKWTHLKKCVRLSILKYYKTDYFFNYTNSRLLINDPHIHGYSMNQ